MNPLEESDLPLERKLADALAKIAIAMRAESWEWFGQKGLNPTQGKILLLLQSRSEPLRLSEVAEELAVTAATVSDSVAALTEKRLVKKAKASTDRRALALSLTSKGVELLKKYQSNQSAIETATSTLKQSDQVACYRALVHIVRGLQQAGRIPVARMCVTCRYFRPNVHESSKRPHHCALVDAAFGDGTLRFNCPEHEAADRHLAANNWETYTES